MNTTKKEISVVIPVYNEELGLRELFKRLTSSLSQITDDYELIFINDASKDQTLVICKEFSKSDAHVKYISFSRNFGHQAALSAGIHYVNCNALVIIDGDMQDPPELIPEMYKKYKEGYNVVYAKRAARKGEKFHKKITASIFYRLLRRITSIDIPLDTGDFRLIDSKVIGVLRTMPEKTIFLRGQIAWIGFKQTFVEFERDPRRHGATGYSFSKMLKFASNGITGFSEAPLRLALWLGSGVTSIATIIMLYLLVSRFALHQHISTWGTVVTCVFFMGGIQLFTIGVIGEYLSRINNETRARPLYVVAESNIETGTN
jgi:dolichol-phosphate mannosyltransferase